MEKQNRKKYALEEYLLESLDTAYFSLTCNDKIISNLPEHYSELKKEIGKEKALSALIRVYKAHNSSQGRIEFNSDDL